MRMLGKAAVAATIAFMSPVIAQAQATESVSPDIENVKLALARQIVDFGFPEETREEIFFATNDQMEAQVREAVLKSMPEQDDGAIAILDEWLGEVNAKGKVILRRHIPTLMDGLTKSYAVMFTETELEDILAFVSTPSGQRFFELSAAVLGEPNFAAANQAYMDEAFAELPASQNELTERLLEYFAAKYEGGTVEDEVS
ncbi:MAG: DUF2059 domain-containing protein [Pseudomonadota bacterium]